MKGKENLDIWEVGKEDLSIYVLPKTKKFGCVGRGDLTFLLLSKVMK